MGWALGKEALTTLDLIVYMASYNFQGRNRLYELIAPFHRFLRPSPAGTGDPGNG